MKKGGAVGYAFLTWSGIELFFQQPCEFRHVGVHVLLFPERAVCAKKRRTVSHERHAGKRFGRLPFAALQRQKAPAARDQKTCHLQILGIQEFTWKAEYNAAEFLLRLPLRRGGSGGGAIRMQGKFLSSAGATASICAIGLWAETSIRAGRAARIRFS